MRKMMRTPIPVQQEYSSYSIQLFVFIFYHIIADLYHLDCNPLQQISINSKDQMILEIDKVRGFINLPVFNLQWNQLFRSQLCNHNEKVRSKCQKKNHKYSLQNDVFNHFSNKFQNSILKIQTTKTFHSDYSNFVPLRNKCYVDKNQCQKQLSFLNHLYQKEYKQEQQKIQEDIDINITNVQKFRRSIHSEYHQFLSFTQKIELYVKLLSYGTRILCRFPKIHSLLYQLTQYQGIFKQTSKIKKNISITVDQQSRINCETIAFTMKSLFCCICFLYDCSIHVDHKLTMGSLGTCQYVSLRNKRNRISQIKSSLDMLNCDAGQNKIKLRCSKQCFLDKMELQKDMKFKITLITKQTMMSDFAKSLISMGIQLFSFDPCKIKSLLPQNELTCSQIHTYLQNQFNTRVRITNKLYMNEQQMLMNQQTQEASSIPKQIVMHNRKKKNKIVNKYKKKSNKNILYDQHQSYESVSICIHHFINQASYDQICLNCICNKRGYCLPSCLCSDQCMIMKIGCKCKKNKKGVCYTDSCPCIQASVECIPQICGRFCSGSQNCCFNQQIQQRKTKNVKISKSKILGAGFGLFAAQPITKDSLVTVYLGQKVDPFIIELRDKLRKNNSFYNFESKGVHLDSRFLGNKSRFINHIHSKSQNLKVRIVKSGGQDWIAFFAIKDIQQGDQLYFDYDGDGELAKHHADKYPFITPK